MTASHQDHLLWWTVSYVLVTLCQTCPEPLHVSGRVCGCLRQSGSARSWSEQAQTLCTTTMSICSSSLRAYRRRSAWQVGSKFPLATYRNASFPSSALTSSRLSLLFSSRSSMSSLAASVSISPVLAAPVSQRCGRHLELRGDLILRLMPAAVSSSHVSACAQCPQQSSVSRPAMFALVLSAQFTGNKTPKQPGSAHKGHATVPEDKPRVDRYGGFVRATSWPEKHLPPCPAESRP